MRPEPLPPFPDLSGFRVVGVQAGPCEFVGIIETEDREEVERSPRYLPNPFAALVQAVARIEAHQAKRGNR
jgi:hypothetical protein